MAQYIFGAGVLTLYNPAGSPIQPVQVGVLKEISLDFKATTKELRGAYRFALDIAAGPMTITGKAKFAQFDQDILSAVTGSSSATGVTRVVESASTVIPATPFTVTVSPPSSGTWARDLGVIDQSTMQPMTRVASAPTAGQYSVTAGAYLFASADNVSAKSVVIRYAYTIAGAVAGYTSTLTNSLMGSNTVYSLEWGTTFRSKDVYMRLPAVIIPSLSMGFKSEDYFDADVEFSAFVDPTSGKIMEWASNE